MEDLVSVVIPAYNAERWISATLSSALAQTYPAIEVIVVDDGSRDSTSAIVNKYAARDQRVQLLSQANCGLAAARNAGIAASRGSLIAPLDADDLWWPEKIAKQVAAMRRAGPGVGLVYRSVPPKSWPGASRLKCLRRGTSNRGRWRYFPRIAVTG